MDYNWTIFFHLEELKFDKRVHPFFMTHLKGTLKQLQTVEWHLLFS